MRSSLYINQGEAGGRGEKGATKDQRADTFKGVRAYFRGKAFVSWESKFSHLCSVSSRGGIRRGKEA